MTNPPTIQDLRRLRAAAHVLNATLAPDLDTFRHANALTYRRLPTDSGDSKINVTSSCTCLMALALSRQLETLYGREEAAVATLDAFSRIVTEEWKSSGLDPDNAFTASLVIRSAGVLAVAAAAPPERLLELIHNGRTIGQIATELGSEPLRRLVVQNYPLTPTIVYWFVDGIHNLGVRLERKAWEEIATWSYHTFARQVSLLSANHDVMMDPVAMGMSACLLARLRTIASDTEFEWRDEILDRLPTQVELTTAICRLFDYQSPSGIWPKYFPLFHYPTAGANYTFSFELLEAILKEFSQAILSDHHEVFQGVERGIAWTKSNRLTYIASAVRYHGWNSGGEVTTLRSGIPESWATAVVHMFLGKLVQRLSDAIQEQVVPAYTRREDLGARQDPSQWDRMIDTPLQIAGRSTTLKSVLHEKILDSFDPNLPLNGKIAKARSALLFGPPGTSKTSVVRAIAAQIGWQYLEINPSHFVRDGLQNIYGRAEIIFDDLMDLSNVVVLFDEMDALVQRRAAGDEARLDVTREFLTTSMLPKFAELHDRGRLLFFMATNHQSGFDEAIKRPGRFDLLLHVAPPNWADKLASLRVLWVGPAAKGDDAYVADRFRSWTAGSTELTGLLDLFTFGETKAFLNDFRRANSLKQSVDEEGAQDRFVTEVKRWGHGLITLREQSRSGSALAEFQTDRESSLLQS